MLLDLLEEEVCVIVGSLPARYQPIDLRTMVQAVLQQQCQCCRSIRLGKMHTFLQPCLEERLRDLESHDESASIGAQQVEPRMDSGCAEGEEQEVMRS